MSRITLNLQSNVLNGAASVDQEWIVSLLRPDEFPLPPGGQALSRSPGVVVVIPLEGVESYLVVGEEIQLFPGKAVVVNGTTCERLSYPPALEGDSCGARVGVIEFNMTFSDTRGLLDVISVPAQLDSRLSDEVIRLYRDMTRAVQEKSAATDSRNMFMHMLAAQLVCVLLQSTETASREVVHGGDRGEELKRLLGGELNKNLTTSDMAKHFKMSRASFAYWSKQVLGTTPAHYRRVARLEHSRELLRGSALSIDEIVSEIGFADRYHFSKAFKKEFGTSPAKFRRTRAASDKPPTPYVLFKQNQFSKALTLCEKTLRTVKDDSERQRLLYLRFQCLEALGKILEAAEAWEALKGSSTVHVAGMQLARTLFERSEYDNSLKLLVEAIQSERDTDRELAIQVWMDHVMSLIRLRLGDPLRNYLDARKQRFVHDVRSIPLTGYAFYLLGDLEEAEQHSKDSRDSLSRLSYQMGKYDEAIANAVPETRKHMTEKIASARRSEVDEDIEELELLKTPEGAMKVLETADPDSGGQVYALHALGRLDELKNFDNKGSFFWHFAQLYANPEVLLTVDYTESPTFVHQARLLLLLYALKAGRDEEVGKLVSECQDIHSPDFFWEDHKSVGVLLGATVRGLVVGREIAESTWKAIRDTYRYTDQQEPWYAAGYLLGEVSEDDYLNQPKRAGAHGRLELLKAIKLDLDGRFSEAKSLYRKMLETRSPYHNLLIYRFLQWRCEA